MMRLKLSIPLLVLMLVGCLTVKEIKNFRKMNKFAPAAESYAKAIQWSDFEAASFFAKNLKTKPDLDKLKNIKVISYEVKKITHQREQLKVIQTINLSYYIRDRLKEKRLRFQEVWEYDEKDGSWYLISGFPEFQWD
ncbi:MAG TPA: hypothetical protein HPQ03_14090 [Deltaproteobacteria bacterium]|nr:hypothetical protein [Deltaproteobacteria bacterium]